MQGVSKAGLGHPLVVSYDRVGYCQHFFAVKFHSDNFYTTLKTFEEKGRADVVREGFF